MSGRYAKGTTEEILGVTTKSILGDTQERILEGTPEFLETLQE